jgi:DNA-binding MarR family transcriptional regulator
VPASEINGQSGDEAEETLSESLRSVARQLRVTSQETLAPWDITPSHLRALRVLGHHGPMRMSDLSDHLHIAPRSGTEVIDALESRRLVERRHDPADRRATLVELSDHGADVLRAIKEARVLENERLFERLTQADQVQLARILRVLRD